MNYQVKSSTDERLVQDFLQLPSELYTVRDVHQNKAEEERICHGTHPLSHYFMHHLFVVYADNRAVGRALLAVYPDDSTAYVGYYECIDDGAAATALFDAIHVRAKKYAKLTRLVGPYNASFWLMYRLKLDGFTGTPYMGEPYNKPYYPAQFEQNGFRISHRYVSNEYALRYDKKEMSVLMNATKRAKRLTYTIKSPRRNEFARVMGDAYTLFSTLYADFPGYKAITRQEFLQSFDGLRPILHNSFIKFAYHGEELAGFAVAYPDYGNLVYRPMTTVNRLRILCRKIRAKRYIVMYIGVLPKHSGLSRALLKPIVMAAALRGATVVGALALEQKVTATYAASLIKNQLHYALYERGV